MKQRILAAAVAAVCALSLFCTAAPVTAHAATGGGGEAVVQSKECIWFYRTASDGTREKRLWSLTEGRWLTAWIPV